MLLKANQTITIKPNRKKTNPPGFLHYMYKIIKEMNIKLDNQTSQNKIKPPPWHKGKQNNYSYEITNTKLFFLTHNNINRQASIQAIV